jgi:hypothetical protein
MTLTQLQEVFFTKLRFRSAIYRSISANQTAKVNKIKAPRAANQVIARNPIWTGLGRPSDSQRTSLLGEFTKINKDVLDALA